MSCDSCKHLPSQLEDTPCASCFYTLKGWTNYEPLITSCAQTVSEESKE